MLYRNITIVILIAGLLTLIITMSGCATFNGDPNDSLRKEKERHEEPYIPLPPTK